MLIEFKERNDEDNMSQVLLAEFKLYRPTILIYPAPTHIISLSTWTKF